MRKLIVFILAILYLGLSTGATVHMHFCMGKMVGSNFFHNNQSDLCSKCGMQKKAAKGKCCKDENKTVKIELDQKLSVLVNHIDDLTPILIFHNHFNYYSTLINSSIKEVSYSNAPPVAFKNPIYIRNCVYRI
jgi:hypothetical protein